MTNTVLIKAGSSFWKHSPNLFTGRILGQRFLNSSLTCNGIFGEKCPGWLRLMTIQQYGVFSPKTSQKYQQEDTMPTYRTTLAQVRYKHSERVREIFQQRLDMGKMKIPAPVKVKSLPSKQLLKCDENIIALIVETCDGRPDSGLFAITAISNKKKFSQVCKPREKLTETVQLATGIRYDDKTDEVFYAGKCVETVKPKRALENLLEYVKAHKNPLFIMFNGKGRTLARLDVLLEKYRLYDEIISAVPYYIDVLQVAKVKYPKESVPNYTLHTLCQKVDFDLSRKTATGDILKRTEGIRQLFTRIPQEQTFGLNEFVCSMNTLRVERSYTEMILQKKISVPTMEKLAGQGVSLDHLKFAKSRGITRFKKLLETRKISPDVIKMLHSVVKTE